MAMNLFAASNQWAQRPDDERFWNLSEMYDQCRSYAETARDATASVRDLRIFASGPVGEESPTADLILDGPAGCNHPRIANWAFGQLCQRIGAPAGYLRGLPAPVAADLVNLGLRKLDDDTRFDVLVHENGRSVARAFLSDDYARIWNWEVLSRLRELESQGWQVPPARPAREGQAGTRPATAADILPNQGDFGLRIKEGDPIAPAGLYASDHDMFAFLVNESRRVDDGSGGPGLGRGVFVSNSEVGAASLRVTRFLYAHVCGNHIVWDASDVQELRIVHRGENDRRFAYTLAAELRKYSDESTADDCARIAACKRVELAGSKDEILDRLFGLRILPRKTLDASYDLAIEQAEIHRCNPRSAWGFAQGITALSQSEVYAEDRVKLDRAAGKVLSLAL